MGPWSNLTLRTLCTFALQIFCRQALLYIKLLRLINFFVEKLSFSSCKSSCNSGAPYLRKFGHLPIREILVITWPYARLPARRPSAPQTDQCKITQPTGMATQMHLEVILAGNRIATRVSPCLVKQRRLKSQQRRKRKAEIVSVSV